MDKRSAAGKWVTRSFIAEHFSLGCNHLDPLDRDIRLIDRTGVREREEREKREREERGKE